jgi:uncharacterized FAD-dependent dehydrogenase
MAEKETDMLQLSQCKLSYKKNSMDELRRKVAKQVHIDVEQIKEIHIVKKSLDARKKPDLFYIYTIQFAVEKEDKILQKNRKNPNLSKVSERPAMVEQCLAEAAEQRAEEKETIVVVGTGPAGLFCAYYLRLCGYRPVLVERGAPVEERMADVRKFWQEGILDEESNVSFGEGGAGTFSDGKLNTGVKDKTGRKRFILESFVKFGAREDILYDSKPHIGTDVLRTVLVNMREEMIRHGCRFYFHRKMTALSLKQNTVQGIETESTLPGGEKESLFLPCDKLVLAIGHSARDTFAMLKESSVAMTQKPFAVGVRVQHLQKDIDFMQYGIRDESLPAAPYKCTGRTKDGRGVYSFCMCPGGYVVNSSSEKGRLVVNGMSDADRDSGNANSAIVVAVEPKDFGSEDVLAGVEFQRQWEKNAYELCHGKIPVQRYEDFQKNQITEKLGKVSPCVKGEWSFGNLRRALPKFIINGMMEGMEQFEQRLSGFSDGDTLLLGIETRTSSPVRIERDENFVSVSVKGLYPCGEGAGYAGGIMSAAMDGMRVAMKIQGGHHA